MIPLTRTPVCYTVITYVISSDSHPPRQAGAYERMTIYIFNLPQRRKGRFNHGKIPQKSILRQS
jgi:hypothetical protein